jgi:hypothetical protein
MGVGFGEGGVLRGGSRGDARRAGFLIGSLKRGVRLARGGMILPGDRATPEDEDEGVVAPLPALVTGRYCTGSSLGTVVLGGGNPLPPRLRGE